MPPIQSRSAILSLMNFLPLTREQLNALKPTYTCSIPSKVHPKSEEIALHILAHFEEHWRWPSEEAKESFITMGIHTSVPYFVPSLDTNEELLKMAAVWFVIWHWIDDTLEQCDFDPQVNLRLFSIITGAAQPEGGNHAELVVYELHEACRKTGSELARRLFCEVEEMLLRWLKCVLSHRMALKSGAGPKVYRTLEDWSAFRKIEIAADVMWVYLRWVLEIDLAPEIVAHPNLQALFDIAGNHGAFINDMYSLRRELNEMQEKAKVGIKMDCPNTITFLATQQGITLAEAMNAISKRVEDYEREYPEAEKKAIEVITALYGEKNGELVRKYAHEIKMFMTGNITWSSQCGRYNDLDIPVPLHHSKTDEEVLSNH